MKKNLKINFSWLALTVVLSGTLEFLATTNISNLHYIQILMGTGISILMGPGTSLVFGFSGQFTLGQVGFMAIGVYAIAVITRQNLTYGGFCFSVLIETVIAVPVALVLDILILRLRGDYLAIAMLGMAEIIRIVIANSGDLTNGTASSAGTLPHIIWPAIFTFVVAATILILSFLRSSTERQVISIHEDEIATEVMDANVARMRVLVSVVGATILVIAGSLYVGYIGTVVPKSLTIMKLIDYLTTAVLGGPGSIAGTILVVTVLGILNMSLQDVSDPHMIIYSLILTLVMIFRPGESLRTKEFILLRPFNKTKGGSR